MLFFTMRKNTSSAPVPYVLPALFLLLLGALIAVPQAFSAEIKITPGILERATWNDNMFLKEFEDFELRTEPGLDFEYASEINQVSLGGKLTDFRYADKNQYDRTIYNLHAQAGRRLSERLKVNAGGGWQRDFSLDTYWDDPTTQKIMLRRDSRNASTGFSYELTEVDTVNISLSWADMEYVKRISGYSDYGMFSGGISWQHIMFDGSMAFVAQGNWQRADFDSPISSGYTLWLGIIPWPAEVKQDVIQNTYSGMAGIYWMPTDRFTVQVLGGIRYTDSEVQTKTISTVNGIEKNTANNYTTGFNGSADITWKYDNGNIKASYNQEYLPSAYGELRRTSTVRIAGAHNYDRKLSLLYTLSYMNSKSDNVTNNAISRDYWNFSAGPHYRFTEDFSATLRYAHTYFRNKISEEDLHANSVFLQLSFDFPKSF